MDTDTILGEIIAEIITTHPLGCYQRALLRGAARWSGADLRGRARSFGGRYARSRRRLLGYLQDAAADRGVEVGLRATAGGPLRLAIL